MTWIVERLPELDGYTIEWAEQGNYYISRRNILFRSETLKPPFKQVAAVEAPSWKSLASRVRLGQRLLRFMFTNVVPLPSGAVFVTFDKTVGVIEGGRYLPLEGLHRPCRVLRSACATDGSGAVYFGEYLANSERGVMRIYRYPGHGTKLETVYSFEPNTIRHIHGIYRDESTDSLFCLTGDDESECRIMQSFDGFQTLEVVGEGDESWRAVSLQFTKDSIFYGTDAEYRSNHIFRLNRETGDRDNLGEVNGTVFYSKRLDSDLFFTTTAENAPSQVENVAALWHVDRELKCSRVASFKKDFWHPSLFMFGTIHFPYNTPLETELFFHLIGVKGDNRTYRARPK